MTVWECENCQILYASPAPRWCTNEWCGGELREIEIGYDAEGVVIGKDKDGD